MLSLLSCGRGTVGYENPVILDKCPDPTILDNRERDGWIYLACTSTSDMPDSDTTALVMPVYRSRDMVHWELCGDGFRGVKPVWRTGADLWAPDLNYVGGKYVVYYALGVWREIKKSGCGVAVADSPDGPYTDIGMLVDYATTGVSNSIDPFFYDDGSHKYLFWGSINKESGIWAVELSDDGLSLKPGTEKVQVGNRKVEAVYIHKHEGWYFLFASHGFCCDGVNSSYHLVVARSRNLLGPYVGKDGKNFLDDDYDEVFLHNSPDSTFTGTGHNSEIFTDDAGQDWIVFHAYSRTLSYIWRSALMEPVCWDNEGWPFIVDYHPHAALLKSPFIEKK